MSDMGFSTLTEQVAQALRDGLQQGRWKGTMPGRNRIAAELSVNHKTANTALKLLENEGLIVSRGAGREREIALTDHSFIKSSLHIKILLYDKTDAHSEAIIDLSFRLKEQGHHVSFAEKPLVNLHFDVKRVIRMVEKNDADAWIVIAGSRDVLEWFASRSIPTFSMFGWHSHLSLPSLITNKISATTKALQQLEKLGHRRIVLITGEEHRKPALGTFEKWFLNYLETMGITVGKYNLPDWKNDRCGLHRCLDSLFRHTPPTALFINDPVFFFATMQNLSSKGLTVPRDVSLIVMEDHPAFEMFDPEVSVISTPKHRWVPRIVQWIDNITKGKEDRGVTAILCKFKEGGMIGPTLR
jgi:DNA-binding LacI/PurR family transcriptional regulator